MFHPKNWCCYSIIGTLPSVQQLQENIEQAPHLPELDKRIEEHVGFIAPPGAIDDQMSVLVKDRFLVFNILHQKRKVPKDIIKENVERWKAKYEAQHGEPPKGTQVREAKEQLRMKLAPHYPPEKKRIGGALDMKKNRLYWSENKPLIVEIANSDLRGEHSTFRYLPGFAPNWNDQTLTQLFTKAFTQKSVEPLLFGESVKLTGPENESVNANNVVLEESDNLQMLIKEDGFEVAKIGLFTKTRFGYASYTIDGKQTLSKWKLLDDDKEAAQANAVDDSIAEQAYAHLDSLDKSIADLFELAKAYNIDDPMVKDKPTPELSQGNFGMNDTTDHSAGAENDISTNLYDEEPELDLGPAHELTPDQQAQNVARQNGTQDAPSQNTPLEEPPLPDNLDDHPPLGLGDDENDDGDEYEGSHLSLVSGGHSA